MIRFAMASGSTPSRPYPTSMRSFRSSTKTKSAAPLSFFAWPTPHFLKARTAKSSIVKFSGSLRSIHTTIWFDVSRSNCSSFRESESTRSAPSTPALSVTYFAGFPGSCSSRERCATALPAAMTARKTASAIGRNVDRPVSFVFCLPSSVTVLWRPRRCRVLEIEIDRGRTLGAGRDRPEVRLLLEPEHRGEEVRREAQPRRVVRLRRVVVADPLDVDAVLCPLQLDLEVAEVLTCFQLGIPLDDDEQPLQRGAELPLSRLETRQSFGVRRSRGGVDLCPSDRSPGVHDRRDEIRDQVRTALVRALDVAPLFVDVLAELDQAVVSAGHRNADDHGEDDDQSDASKTEFPHGCSSF